MQNIPQVNLPVFAMNTENTDTVISSWLYFVEQNKSM